MQQGRAFATQVAFAMLLPLLLVGCGKAGYYLHLAGGQWDLLSSRTPISSVISDPNTPPALAEALREVLAVRQFAIDSLALPDNGSYTTYVDLQRDAVVWNVMATPRYSLEALERCHWFVGCLAYQGFFDPRRADVLAAELAEQGWDAMVAPVPAYSTLGRFKDPVVSSMLAWGRSALLGTVIHEMTHERLFIASDTTFNESYASFVEAEGLRQWQALRGTEADPDDRLRQQRRREFIEMVLTTRAQLAVDYVVLAGDDDALETAKQARFTDLRQRYQQRRDHEWNGWRGYDAWFDRPLNNAHLLPFGLYDEWVPAFATLFDQVGRDWPAFHEAVKQLGNLPTETRHERLEQLLASTPCEVSANPECG